MKNLYSKYFPILLLIFLDFISVLLSVYLSASFIQINFIPYLNLFFYYSCVFFVIIFFIYLYLGNYTYLNRTFAIHNIKSLIYGSILIFVVLYIFKNILEFNKINLYFWDKVNLNKEHQRYGGTPDLLYLFFYNEFHAGLYNQQSLQFHKA